MANLQRPHETDQRLAEMLAQSCALRPGISSGTLTPMSKSPNLTLARRLLSDALAPARPERIVEALGVMGALVARRAVSDEDLDLRLTAYTERLRQYPEDVVMSVLHDWPSRSEFWPTWRDLQIMIDDRMRWRNEVAAALDRAATVALAAPDEPTPAERAERAAHMRAAAKGLATSKAPPRGRGRIIPFDEQMRRLRALADEEAATEDDQGAA